MCNSINKMLLSPPRSLAPTHRWEMTHTYFSGVSACSECNSSCLHAEAKSALVHLSLSFTPLKTCPSLLFTRRRKELRIQTHRFALQKTSMKTIPQLFPQSVCLPKGLDQLLFDLYKWNKWNFGGRVCLRIHTTLAKKDSKVFFELFK